MADTEGDKAAAVDAPEASTSAVSADAPGESVEPAAEAEESEDEDAYAGDLPEFSDEEQAAAAPKAGTGAPKVIKGARRKPGLPLSKLKQRVTGSSANKGTAVVAASKEPKQLKISDSVMKSLVEELQAEQGPDKGEADVRELLSQMQVNDDLIKGKAGLFGRGAKDTGGHKFWKTQPVPQLTEKLEEIKEGPLQPNTPHDKIPKDPLPLHADFKWVTVDLANDEERKEVYELLTHHYVEDADASFRFDYSADFIAWALQPPGYVKDLHVGIRVAESGKLVGFIAGILGEVRIRAVTKKCSEINFLCVHKKLRTKRLAPLLIKEVTRRSHLQGVFQACYTGGTVIPTPITRCQYYHRSLNPKKLVETGFSAVPSGGSLARMQLALKLPAETALPGLREMLKKDVKPVGRLLRAYLGRMDLAPNFSNKDVEHILLAGKGRDVKGKREGQVMWTYVVEDPATHEITDFFSFYSLPSTALKVTPNQRVNAAYLFYYATTSCPACANIGDGSTSVTVPSWQTETPEERQVLKARLQALMNDANIIAKNCGFDVVNCLTSLDNALFIEDLKFGRGDGFLNYYLYNYATKPIMGGIDLKEGGSSIGLLMP